MRRPRRGFAVPTRVLLICAALAGIHAVLHLLTLPLLSVLAPAAPPAYALVASLHSLMPFLARRVTRVPGTALITSAIAAVFVAATSSLGLIALIPLVLTGVVIDAVIWTSDTDGVRRETRFVVAGVSAGIALWAVSLTVFSPDHLTAAMLVATLAARVAGELAVVALSRAVAAALARAGVGRARAPQSGQPKGSGESGQPKGSGETGLS
ncbi:hypothetical protein [Microbacterium sp. TNHR37B]|uniref:hypothetical protein n=1 Tax=Microbacterium sp. TNHR37B TaxID=1775956 RepID=UPI0007B2C8E9|nr:hypothetical protein [Microbacterium sp. TNHR37B]KZE89426.1 hypothetical protein AVP41_02220 [Microbacterium sp. TNHR37B]